MRARTLLLACCFGVVNCSEPLAPELPGPFTALATGAHHTCALLQDSTAYCWGRNLELQLGTGGSEQQDSLPRVVATGLRFTQIAVGETHTCALTAIGAAYCWGDGTHGQLGKSGTTSASAPVPVDGGLTFRAIAAGARHTCALTDAGEAYCWGENAYQQLGHDTAADVVGTPVPVGGGLIFISIKGGETHTCGIAPNHAAYCWGNNMFGMVGSGDSAASTVALPAAVAGGLTFKSIAGAMSHTCGITTAGAAYCWGGGDFGQLGIGPTTGRHYTPEKVVGGGPYASVSVGNQHSCALDVDGRLWCWGASAENQLAAVTRDKCLFTPGSPNFVPCSEAPILAARDHYFQSVTAGSYYTCALGFSGAAYCWGQNDWGQIGNASLGGSVSVPTRVTHPIQSP